MKSQRSVGQVGQSPYSLPEKISSDKRFKPSTKEGVSFEAGSFSFIEDDELRAYGAKRWTRGKSVEGDNVVLILEMSNHTQPEAKKIVKKDVEVLNVKLLETILKGNFDETTIQELLDQGASPTEKYLFKGIQTTALSAILAKWVVQGFMPNNPVDRICSQLKRHAEELPAAQELFAHTCEDAYAYLFGEKPHINPVPSDKVAAIKKILVDVYQLLNSVEKCIPLFEIIEEELKKEWKKTHDGPIPKLDEKEYQVQSHDRTLYPVPGEGYKKTCFPKKNSVLQRTLYRMMRDTGLVKIPPQKWIQGIPREESKKYLRQNVFFVEDRSHPTGLLHGKVSHNIQRLLIYLAIKKNLVNIPVGNFHITLEELFSSLMDKQYAKQQTKSLLWMRLLDTRFFSYVTLRDPHRLHSLLMTSDKRSQFRLLSDCMIHSFCNGMVEISEILNYYHSASDKVKIWTPKKVWDRMLSCMSTQYFFDFDLNVHFRESKKGYQSIISRGTRGKGKNAYLILEKNYTDQEDSKKKAEPGAYVKVESVAGELQSRVDQRQHEESFEKRESQVQTPTSSIMLCLMAEAALAKQWEDKHLEDYRRSNPKLQREYDNRHGLVLYKSALIIKNSPLYQLLDKQCKSPKNDKDLPENINPVRVSTSSL